MRDVGSCYVGFSSGGRRLRDGADLTLPPTPLTRSLHAITRFNDREQRSRNFLHAGFTAYFPIKDAI